MRWHGEKKLLQLRRRHALLTTRNTFSHDYDDDETTDRERAARARRRTKQNKLSVTPKSQLLHTAFECDTCQLPGLPFSHLQSSFSKTFLLLGSRAAFIIRYTAPTTQFAILSFNLPFYSTTPASPFLTRAFFTREAACTNIKTEN